MEYVVKVLQTELLSHNVRRFVVERPADYVFEPGQATEIAINTPKLRAELRPFTFTCANDAKELEFIIKIYTGHDGMTEKLEKVQVGDELIVHDIFGSIAYKGRGLFIAAGAGITPFISIFRQLGQRNGLEGNALLFANRTPEDIFLKDELNSLLGSNYTDVVEKTEDGTGSYITRGLLEKHMRPEFDYFYICGPQKFTNAMIGYLNVLGIDRLHIVIEE